MTPEQEEAHDKLLQVALGKIQLTGVNPPDAGSASSGTWQGDMPDSLDAPPAPTAAPPTTPAPSAAAAVPPKPPVDLSKPIGFSASPPTRNTDRLVQRDSIYDSGTPDAGYRDAQAADERSKAMGKLGQSVTAMGERPMNFADYAIGLGRGGKSAPAPHSTLWDDQAQNGEGAVSKLMAQRKADAEMTAQRTAAAKAADAKDHDSPTAKLYRTVLAKFAPDLGPQLEGATPEQMERIAPWLEKYADAESKKKPEDATKSLVEAETLKKLRNENGAFDDREASKKSKADLDAQLEAERIGAMKRKGATKPVSHVVAGNLESIEDPAERETVRAIVEGRAKAPDPGSRYGTHILGLVTQVDPKFDATSYGAYKDVKEKLSKSDEVNALNTAYGHIKRAKENIPDNFDSQALNKIRQVWLTGSGSDTLTPFETDVKIAADELAKAYGNNSEAGRSTIEHLLAPGQSKAQLQSRLAEVEELLSSKLGSYQNQFQRVAPKGAAPFQVLAPEGGGTVKMRFPNGAVADVPTAEVAEAKSHGGTQL